MQLLDFIYVSVLLRRRNYKNIYKRDYRYSIEIEYKKIKEDASASSFIYFHIYLMTFEKSFELGYLNGKSKQVV